MAGRKLINGVDIENDMADFRKILQGAGEKARQVADQVNNIADQFKTSDEVAAIKKGTAEGIEAIKNRVAEIIEAIKKGVAEIIEAIREKAKEKTGDRFEAIKNTGRGILQPSSFALGIWIGLWLPDVDLTMLPILHHRSILTHSVLIPWLLCKFAKKRIPEYGIAGLYAGIAIHLSADCLSSLVGFGMIWTPWPFKVPLGPISPIWIVANAILGVRLSLKLAPANRNWIIGGMLLVGVGYALLNELAFLPFVVFGLIVSLVVWLCRKKVQKNPL